MEKLSEGGRLYLQEFYILQEAQNDVFNFLNEIVEKTYQNLLEKKDLLPVPEDFSWEIWKSQSSPGTLEVYAISSKEFRLFKKGKSELYLQYLDVRHDSELTETGQVSLSIHSRNEFRKKIRQLPAEVTSKAFEEAEGQDISLSFEQRVINRSEVKLDLDSATKSSDIISGLILERCGGLEAFISSLKGQIG